MVTIVEGLTELVRQASGAAGHADAPVPLEPVVPTNDPKFGDYQSNFAFRLGKALGTNPRQVAQHIADHMPPHPMIAGVEVAGPGFLNFRLSDAWLGERLAQVARDARFAGPTPGAGQTLVIDYSSPNIAKRMHVAHLRSTVIGNALDRMYRYLGYDVVADNHLGDWGTPFGKLIVAWRGWRDDEAYAADPLGELQRLYESFKGKAEADPTLEDAARAETARLQAGDAANRALWEQFVAVSMEEFQAVYDRLGVRFDVALGESAYDDMLADTVTALVSAGIADEEAEGAVVVRFTEDDGKGLADRNLVLRKSDGAATYGLTDVATVRYRVTEWTPSRIVYVTDVRQKLHFQQFFRIAERLGVQVALEHVTFGMLRFADGAVASSRAGNTITLVDVLDEAVRRAREVVDTHAEDIPDEQERAAIAEIVGLGAVKYADLSQNPTSDIVFEWDKMLALQGNTAPYLMYAHARCRSVLRKGGYEDHEPVAMLPDADEARALVMALLRLPEVIEVAATGARPNLLADHLYGIASAFAKFWLACPVLRDDVPDELRRSRISVVVATARGLRLGLGLLGIGAPERM